MIVGEPAIVDELDILDLVRLHLLMGNVQHRPRDVDSNDTPTVICYSYWERPRPGTEIDDGIVY